MEHVLDLVAALSVALILLVLLTLRRERIRVEYSVSWLMAGIALILLSRSSGALSRLAYWLHLGNPLLALVALISITFLIVFFRFSVILSQLKDANVANVQRIAILEYKLSELHEEKQSKQSSV